LYRLIRGNSYYSQRFSLFLSSGNKEKNRPLFSSKGKDSHPLKKSFPEAYMGVLEGGLL
jgi:hypothetical protein